MAAPHSIKLAIDLSKGILVQAKGHPAKVVSYGAAAAVVLVATAVGYGSVEGGKAIYGGVKGWLGKRRNSEP